MTKIDRGAEMLLKAENWIKKNGDGWEQMKALAQSLVDKRQPFSMDFLANVARYYMIIAGDESGFKVNNDYRAPLARIMIKENPALEDYIEKRKSKVDPWMS